MKKIHSVLICLVAAAVLILAVPSIFNGIKDHPASAETENTLSYSTKDNLIDISESSGPTELSNSSNDEAVSLLTSETEASPTATPTPKPTLKPTPKATPKPTPKPTAKPTATPGVANPAPSSKGKFTAQDVYMVAQLIYAEGRNQSIAGFEAMANVILNRCYSKKFPNTVKGVIFQKNQFSVVKSEEKFASIKPNKRAQYAAARIFNENKRVLPRYVLFFRSARSSEKWGSRVYYATIGGNKYYK